ncbi:acyltransferase family protein [Frigidibacter oleivorans]|uniref:acyltransferase family protein n=1 Tax=Frigidibacter oleivorans TaxID=2487129 RepID=UPI0013E065AC|nr:acyltransferase family protein [Frigidibacter oleivorans]
MSSSERFHFLDSARALCMVLGIPYHAGLIYHPGMSWRADSPQDSMALGLLSQASSNFRMQLFFIIAGFFSAMMIGRRTPEAWMRQRMQRLLLPFVAAMILIIPFQIAAEAFLQPGAPPGTRPGEFLYQLRQPWWNWGHLWFLLTLFWLSLGFATATMALQATGWRLPPARGLPRLPRLVALAVLVVAVTLWSQDWMLLRDRFGLPVKTAMGFVYVEAIVLYLPFFALGVWFWLDRAALEGFATLSPPVLLLAAAALGLSLHAAATQEGRLAWLFQPAAAILVSAVVLGLLRRVSDNENRTVRRLVDASFTIYLVHQPLVVILGSLFLWLALPPAAEYLVIIAGTFLLSWALAQAVAARPWLQFLLNGAARRRPAREPAPPAARAT